jgi:CRP-like cAMP-binding protein
MASGYICNALLMTNYIDRFYFRNDRLLTSLPPHVRAALEKQMVRKKIAKGKYIYREGAYPRGVYFITRGKVKIFQTNSEGKEQIMYVYCKGEVMGYRPLLSSAAHPVSAVALEDCSYRFISGKDFMNMLNQFPELNRELLRSLSHEFTVWVNNISVFAQQKVRERVALGLLILQQKYMVKGKPVDISLSREDFANYVGTVKETLVRVLQEFKIKKIVSTQGSRIKILNIRELERIAGQR